MPTEVQFVGVLEPSVTLRACINVLTSTGVFAFGTNVISVKTI